MSIQSILSQAFGQSVPLSSKEIADLLPLVNSELARLDERFGQINSTGKGDNGTLYRELLLKGTPEQVAEMKAECDRLVIERDQLRAKSRKLAELKQAALITEATAELPDLQRNLIQCIEVAEQARRALAQAFSAIDAAYNAVTVARGRIKFTGAEPTVNAQLGTLSSLNALGALARAGGLGNGPWANARNGHEENIGLDRGRRIQAPQAAQPQATWSQA